MYSHYIDGAFAPLIKMSGSSESRSCDENGHEELPGSIASGIANILKNIGGQFSVGNLDTGDLLLVLIILLLFLEGDNLELVITLGLMLLLGLSD